MSISMGFCKRCFEMFNDMHVSRAAATYGLGASKLYKLACISYHYFYILHMKIKMWRNLMLPDGNLIASASSTYDKLINFYLYGSFQAHCDNGFSWFRLQLFNSSSQLIELDLVSDFEQSDAKLLATVFVFVEKIHAMLAALIHN